MGLVNNNTWFISLYLPVGVMIGWGVDAGVSAITRLAVFRRGVAQMVIWSAWSAATVWSGLFGLRQMVEIVNPETVLVRPDDLILEEWAEALLPTDAVVAVNSWPWFGEKNWAGSDGGYWLLPLTGRETTMPPIGYGLDGGFQAEVNEFNRQLAAIEDWEADETVKLLQARGVTHFFTGARGGSIRPELLLRSSRFRLLASNGGAWLFEVDY